MNLRILKKLSKRAAPLLPHLGERRGQFRARKHENYTGILIKERKCWDRWPTHPNNPVGPLGAERGFRVQARAGHKYVLRPTCHPMNGTIMVGAMEGHEEPEWSEETAYEALQRIVEWNFMVYDQETEELGCSRPLGTPSMLFQAAADMRAEREAAGCVVA